MLSLFTIYRFAVETIERGKRKIREANVTLIIRISWFRNDSSITANDGSTSNAFPQGLVSSSSSSFPPPPARPREMNTPSWRHLMPGAHAPHNAPPPLLWGFCRPLWSAQINRDQRLGQLPRPNRIEIVAFTRWISNTWMATCAHFPAKQSPKFASTITDDADVRNEIFTGRTKFQLFDRAE